MAKIEALLLLTSVPFLFTGCASTGTSMATGGLLGGVGGAAVGAMADPGKNGQYRVRNIVVGSAVGVGVGAATGFLLGRQVQDEREKAKKEGEEKAKSAPIRGYDPNEIPGSPTLIPPKTEAFWVPDQTRGTTFVPGHFEYKIVAPARWQTP